MMGQYQFRLYVTTPMGTQMCSAFNVEAFVANDFGWKPYDLCSDSFTASMSGGVTHSQAMRIDNDREALAKQISESLTQRIMKSIKSEDLRNGYKQKELD
jgi:hypothetical protein